jgi:hypothetical protein
MVVLPPPMRIALFALAFTAAVSQAATGPPELFYGIGRCLAVVQGQVLKEGQPLVVVGPGLPPAEVAAGPLRVPSEVVAPLPDVPAVNCWRQYRAEPPAAVSELALSGPLQEEVVFAVRKQRRLLVIAGPPVRLSIADTARWVGRISSSLPSPWRAKGQLAHAYRYRSSSGRSAVELYLGRPALTPAGDSPPIEVITIRRLFIVDGRLLASEEYTRESGVEERVDSEGPQLTFENWSASGTERTVAFLSTDRGRSWTRLSTNVGFEGFVWIAQELRAGLPRTYDRYLYTSH